MKKLLFVMVTGAFISMSMISCNKCGHCSGGTYPTTEACEKTNKTIYEAAKQDCEAGGGSWVL